MRIHNIAGLGLLIITIAGCPSEGNPQAEKAAIESAQGWLELVDNGQFAESWNEAAQYFKSLLTKEKWEESLQAVRNPLGKVFSRELESQQYTTSLPGAPDGEYVVIQYKTTFENKKEALETVTPMLDKDGTWRVSGYYVR